ncbi:rust resistance kinase Lr10 isoform X1 [Cinnamomum micranthum f. kanehirae]|uniref:Rust resistance kinase Lr10 isoform X1 n=1 Tax=Cinnamomum micranthum f. kanehirae TaxID=337451 RepID=A0A3S3MVD2_9MAGN|nr:rust resistance kinase Lr10 isoform X1 [Cinnamomum micranthum f. kanehirae]
MGTIFFCLASLSVVMVFLQCNAEMGEICSPSSCGSVENVSYPFRLKTDPINCGLQSFELSCESNNRTILSLQDSKKFYVDTISYDQGKLRIVDSGLERDNCSSLPRYFLDPGDMFYQFYLPTSEIEEITYVNCSAPMESLYYIATAPCFNSSSPPYFYVIIGYMDLTMFTNDNCTIISSASLAAESLAAEKTQNLTYTDIHKALLMGFDIYWDPPQTLWPSCERGSAHCIIKTILQGIYDFLVEHLPILGRIMIARTSIGMFCLAVLLIYKLWRERLSKDENVKKFVSKYKSHMNYSYHDVKKMALHFKVKLEYTVTEFLIEHKSKDENIEDFLNRYKNHVPMRYSYSNIKKMTHGFKEKLGQGGYGSVYKGELPNGHLVAVKMLNKSKGNGQEFINEVATIGRIHHVNIVQLIGFCSKGSKRALIYDFMPNGSLEKYIFSQEGESPLSWEKLYDIALGVARGIGYLHRGCDVQILHFDIKPHNILLDENFTPKVSDFGLAKFYPTEESIVSITAARGTLGYMAPELFYRNIGRVSYKSDVYSFGMMLLEIAGRRKNINANAENLSQVYFPSWVYSQLNQGKDIGIQNATPDEEETAKKLIIIALWCIQMKPIDRPSMSKVVEMLEGRLELLQMPPKPFLSPNQVTEEDNIATSSGT